MLLLLFELVFGGLPRPPTSQVAPHPGQALVVQFAFHKGPVFNSVQLALRLVLCLLQCCWSGLGCGEARQSFFPRGLEWSRELLQLGPPFSWSTSGACGAADFRGQAWENAAEMWLARRYPLAGMLGAEPCAPISAEMGRHCPLLSSSFAEHLIAVPVHISPLPWTTIFV